MAKRVKAELGKHCPHLEIYGDGTELLKFVPTDLGLRVKYRVSKTEISEEPANCRYGKKPCRRNIDTCPFKDKGIDEETNRVQRELFASSK